MPRTALVLSVASVLMIAACGGASPQAGAIACPGDATCAPRSPGRPSERTKRALAELREAAASQLPEALAEEYRRALARERADDYAGARNLYADLETKLCADTDTGDSDAEPYIHFAYGEMFFHESLTYGSYYANAEMQYSMVLEHPPRQNPLYPFALLRLAELAERAGDLEKARAAYGQLTTELASSVPSADVPRWAQPR